MGTAHEQSGHDSRRNSAEQRNIQLDLFDVMEEAEDIEEVENISSVSSISDIERGDQSPASDKPEIPDQVEQAAAKGNPEPSLLEMVINLRPESAEAKTASQPRRNYRITDEELGVGGAKTKFRNNVEAIRTLKAIESEDRLATPEEQEILSRYVGWGGLPQAFDESNEDWKKEYAELKELLTDEEYASARGSTLNAHYTSPRVARAMYETLERMGFT